MKTNNLKLIYPKHFITTFSIEDQTKITVVDLITLIKDKGILQSEQQAEQFHIFKWESASSYQQVNECCIGIYFLINGQDTSQISDYMNTSIQNQERNTKNAREEQRKWKVKQQMLKAQKQRLQQIKVPAIKKRPSRRRLLTPPKKPIKLQSEQQNIQNAKLLQSEILPKKTISYNQSTPSTAIIPKKNILSILKLTQSTQQSETVNIKYYLGKLLILQQNIKKLSVIRNKIRDIYDIYQDQELTKQVKKVTIALNDRIFYCKRKFENMTINNTPNSRYTKDQQQFLKESQNQNPQESLNKTSGIFRINRKRHLKNETKNNPSIDLKQEKQIIQRSEQASQKNLNEKNNNASIFHVRKTVNLADRHKN